MGEKRKQVYLTPLDGWKNVTGSSDRSPCNCGSWKNHWINFSGEQCPSECSVEGCRNEAKYGGHIRNPKVKGEKIVPLCASCNGYEDKIFTLKANLADVSANRSETCESSAVWRLTPSR